MSTCSYCKQSQSSVSVLILLFSVEGSCDSCEKKCSPVFTPVCDNANNRLFANACHAKCAGVEEAEECSGVRTIIPGKSKLPPNRVPPKKLQEKAEEDVDIKEDEDV